MTHRLSDDHSSVSYPQSIADAAAINNFYTVRTAEGEKSDVVERLIGTEIESPAAPLVARICAGGWITPAERTVLARFVLFQHLRTPVSRDWYRETNDMLMKINIGTDGPEALEDYLAYAIALGVSVTATVDPPSWAEPSSFRFVVPDEELLRHSIRDTRNSTILVDRYCWHPIRFNKQRLLTSDSPVGFEPSESGGRAIGTAHAITLALDRRTAIVLAAKEGHSCNQLGLKATVKRARRLNELTISGASRWVYTHPDDKPTELLPRGLQLRPTPPSSVQGDENYETLGSLFERYSWPDWKASVTSAGMRLAG